MTISSRPWLSSSAIGKFVPLLDVSSADLPLGVPVNHGDLPCFRHVPVETGSTSLEAKRFRMGLERDGSSRRSRCSVDQGERAVAMADHHLSVPQVEARIVGVLANPSPIERLEFGIRIAPQGAVTTARDKVGDYRRYVGDALWFVQTADPAEQLLLSAPD